MRQSKRTEAATSPTFQHFSMSSLLYVVNFRQNKSRHLQIASSKCLTFLEAKEIGIIGLPPLLSLLKHLNPFFPGRQLACRCNSCQTGCEHWRCRREPFSPANAANTFAQFLHCHVQDITRACFKKRDRQPGRLSVLHMSQNVWEPANLAVGLAFIQRELELNQSRHSPPVNT